MFSSGIYFAILYKEGIFQMNKQISQKHLLEHSFYESQNSYAHLSLLSFEFCYSLLLPSYHLALIFIILLQI